MSLICFLPTVYAKAITPRLSGRRQVTGLLQVFPDLFQVPAIAVTGSGFRKSREVRAELQGTVVAVLEEGFAVDAKEFFRLLDGDPSFAFGHGARNACSYNVSRDKELSRLLRYLLGFGRVLIHM